MKIFTSRRELFEFMAKEYPNVPCPCLFNIALDLRASLNGSGDPWPEVNTVKAISIIVWRLVFWYPALKACQQVDRSAYHFLRNILQEVIFYGPHYANMIGDIPLDPPIERQFTGELLGTKEPIQQGEPAYDPASCEFREPL